MRTTISLDDRILRRSSTLEEVFDFAGELLARPVTRPACEAEILNVLQLH